MNETEPMTSAQMPAHRNAALVLADGSVFFGQGVGKTGTTVGEVCFNTSMTGYQEILTDPSYAGQIITFTFPHIGNVGANEEDIEARKPFASGLILKLPITEPSNYRSLEHLNNWLISKDLTGITGIDTRALTRHIRLKGPQNVAIGYGEAVDIPALLQLAKEHPTMVGRELASEVTCEEPYEWHETIWQFGQGYGENNDAKYHVVAVDFGAKLNILRCLAEVGCRVTVVPAKTTAEDILAYKPDGVFLSNGPGDPAATGEYALPMIRALVEANVPIFGICLGHQLLSLALGCKTEKMHQGHRGANHPVHDIMTGKVEITSQNHGFVVKKDALSDGVIKTHTSLFDQTNEGVNLEGKHVFSVQHHPEASPGPHDSFYLFKRFVEMMENA